VLVFFFSVKARHSIGGATLARKRLAVERHQRTLSHPTTSNRHVYTCVDGHPTQETNLASKTSLLESGINYASLTAHTKSSLEKENFSYEQLSSLREFCYTMEDKKKIR